MSRNITLKINASGTRTEGIEEFRQSYYAREYAHAFQIVKNMLSQKIDTQKRGHGEEESEVFNIIPFIGGRGTGKTTAMCSFARALEEYHSYVKIGKAYYYDGYLSFEQEKYCGF